MTTPRSPGITLNAGGYFTRNGIPFMPVGVNYWPASCGVEMWQAWPEAEIRHDLDVVRSLGLNCVRFFLRWPDFEPSLGAMEPVMFDRLARLLEWCAERDLLAHPALVTGFMSGGHFWPAGKDGRNLYADARMREHSAAYCRRAAAVIAPYHATVLALDLGNELGCADAWPAPPAAIEHWCATVTTAIREAYPDCLIVSGTDSGVVSTDCGWRLDAQPGTDFYSVHTYPVQDWNVVPFDGMTDPLCQAILPFSVRMARAFGPVMVQEFSTILMHDPDPCEAYLKTVMPACLANGANGFLWWCLRDIEARVHPYQKSGMEQRLGLVDTGDSPKPATAWVLDFMQSLRDWAPQAQPALATALLVPAEYYKRDNPRNPGNDPSTQFRRLLIAAHLLERAGHATGIVRGGGGIDPAVKTLVIAGSALTGDESERILDWVRQGGRLLWTGPSWHAWNVRDDALIGAQPADLRFARPVSVEAFGQRWTLTAHPSGGRLVVRPLTADVVAADEEGVPAVLCHTVGRGRVVTVLPQPEDTIAGLTANRAERDRWAGWYAGLLECLNAPVNTDNH